MTVFSVFLTAAACAYCCSAKRRPIVDPEGQAHPNQLLEHVNSVHDFEPLANTRKSKYLLHEYSVYTSE